MGNVTHSRRGVPLRTCADLAPRPSTSKWTTTKTINNNFSITNYKTRTIRALRMNTSSNNSLDNNHKTIQPRPVQRVLNAVAQLQQRLSNVEALAIVAWYSVAANI